MIGELHCHSCLSLPRFIHRHLPSPFALVDHAVSLGVDFLAITDHNSHAAFSYAQHYALQKGLVLVPAVEVSACFRAFSYKQVHILAYGVTGIIRPFMSIDDTLACIHSQGGIAVAAHPFCLKYGKILYIGHSVSRYPFDGIEVFNSEEAPTSNAQAFALAQSLGMLQFAGSDSHCLASLGSSRIKLFGDPTLDWREIVFRLKCGQFCIVSTSYYNGHRFFKRLRSSPFAFMYHCIRGRAS